MAHAAAGPVDSFLQERGQVLPVRYLPIRSDLSFRHLIMRTRIYGGVTENAGDGFPYVDLA